MGGRQCVGRLEGDKNFWLRHLWSSHDNNVGAVLQYYHHHSIYGTQYLISQALSILYIPYILEYYHKYVSLSI